MIRDELIANLAQTLGREKAIEVIDDAARRLYAGRIDEAAAALAILGDLAATPGIVGTVSRFVKVRWHLRR